MPSSRATPSACCAGDAGQRRAADQRVAVLHFAHHCLRHRTSARDVLQELGNVLDALGAAVRDQQNSLLAHGVLAEVAAVELNSCTNLRQVLHVVHRRVRQNAVAQIEDVSRARIGQPQNVLGALLHFAPRREQQHRIEIALHGVIVPDRLSSLRRAECASRGR